jgi:hypothetical protein
MPGPLALCQADLACAVRSGPIWFLRDPAGATPVVMPGGFCALIAQFYPFTIAATASGQGRLVVCEADTPQQDPDLGQPFFDRQGQPTAALAEIMAGLGRWQADHLPLRRAAQALDAEGLLVPCDPVRASQSEGVPLRMDLAAYGALSDAAVLRLHRSGAVRLAEAHLLSCGPRAGGTDLGVAQASGAVAPEHGHAPKPDFDANMADFLGLMADQLETRA